MKDSEKILETVTLAFKGGKQEKLSNEEFENIISYMVGRTYGMKRGIYVGVSLSAIALCTGAGIGIGYLLLNRLINKLKQTQELEAE